MPIKINKDKQSYIQDLAHLYVDGAFDRRELLTRVARVADSVAAATVALESLGYSRASVAPPTILKKPCNSINKQRRKVGWRTC